MELTEETSQLLSEMLGVILEHGYELDGNVDDMDPDKFLSAVADIAEQDEDLPEQAKTWLGEALSSFLVPVEEAAPNPKSARSYLRNSGVAKTSRSAPHTKAMKRWIAKADRRAGKKALKNSTVTSGWSA